MEWWQILAGLAAPIIALAGTWLTARFTARSAREATAADNWKGLLAEQREWIDDVLAERDLRIDRLQGDLDQVRGEVSELRGKLDVLAQKYRVALLHIRELIRHCHAAGATVPDPPEAISGDL